MEAEVSQFYRLCDSIGKAIDRLPNKIAAEAVNFSKQRFRRQAWVDNTTEPWKKRKSETGWGKRRARPGRHILVDSGKLLRSVRKIVANSSVVIIGSDMPYARIHNNGEAMDVTQHVKGYTRSRARVRTASGRLRRQPGGDVTVKPFSRHLKFKMPKRQFLGQSAVLNRRLARLITLEIINASKNIR